MTKKLQNTCIILILGLLVTACAAPARVGNMVPDKNVNASVKSNSLLSKQVEIKEVSGGKETNPMWTSQVGNKEFEEALKFALLNHNLLAKEEGRYSLNVQMIQLDQPVFGADFTVTAEVQYTLTDISTNTVVLDEKIVRRFTATMSDSFYGVERLRLANEGAIKTNLTEFIRLLIQHAEKSNLISNNEVLTISDISVELR